MELHGTLTQDRNQECYMKSNLQYTDVFDIGATIHNSGVGTNFGLGGGGGGARCIGRGGVRVV